MIEQFIAFCVLIVLSVFAYIGIHMSYEKEAQKRIPLTWEPGGFLYELFKSQQKQFDKSDIKYRDGDNT
jgi:hypothetical protein